MKNIAIAILFFLPFLNSCKKGKQVIPAGSVDVYVVGEVVTATGIHAATYWKNGAQVSLAGKSASSEANAVTVSGGDVYIAGNMLASNGYLMAVYWKNGIVTRLSPDTTADYGANAICVSGNDVYVAGGGPNGPVYWKNGSMVNLPNSPTAMSTGIAVIGADVYVSGTNGYGAAYWKNAKVFPLGAGAASGIVVQGNDVYISGTIGGYLVTKPVYWKNGAQNSLPYQAATATTGIAVANGNVYVAGVGGVSQGEYMPSDEYYMTYWKNGTLAYPGGGESSGTAVGGIAVSGTDVYIAGTDNVPAYWKNGSVVHLSAQTGNAFGIAVATR